MGSRRLASPAEIWFFLRRQHVGEMSYVIPLYSLCQRRGCSEWEPRGEADAGQTDRKRCQHLPSGEIILKRAGQEGAENQRRTLSKEK